MTVPAALLLSVLDRDPALRRCPAARALFAALAGRPNALVGPLEVRAWLYAERLHVDRKSIYVSLNRLIRAGYLDEAPREGPHAPRRVTVRTGRMGRMGRMGRAA